MEIKHFVSWFEDKSESMTIKKTSKHFQHFKDFPGDIPVKNTMVNLVIQT